MIENMARKLAASAFQQPWKISASSVPSSAPRCLQSLLVQTENRTFLHEQDEQRLSSSLMIREEEVKVSDISLISSLPSVFLRDLHKSASRSLFPWPRMDTEHFSSSIERELHRCASIDLERIWRVSTNSSYMPPPSEEIEEVILPGQHEDTASPMLTHTKRTFNPSTIVRKRRHGFLARKSTVGGRRVLARRLAKGRRILSA